MARTPSVSCRHRLEYVLFRVLAMGICAMPWRATFRLGRFVGRVAHFLDARHRRVVRDNLRASDLGLAESEIRRLARACFAHFGGMTFTSLCLLTMSPDRLRQVFSLQGQEHYDAAKAQGKGFIVLTGHYGNWEMLALAASLEGRPLSVIGRKLDNPLLEPWMRKLRGRFGNRVLSKEGAVRDTLKALKANEAVGYLLDQDALTRGTFVRFMGRWAATHTAAGQLALRSGIPVMPLFSHQEADGTVRCRFYPLLDLPRSGDAEKDVWVATQVLTWLIEASVRHDPSQWFWMHRRFKTRPMEGWQAPQEWEAAAKLFWEAYRSKVPDWRP